MPISTGEWRVRIGRFVHWHWQQEPSDIELVHVIHKASSNAETCENKGSSSADSTSTNNNATSDSQSNNSRGEARLSGDDSSGASKGLRNGENRSTCAVSDEGSSKCETGPSGSTPGSQPDSEGCKNTAAPQNDGHTVQPMDASSSCDVTRDHKQGYLDPASPSNSPRISVGKGSLHDFSSSSPANRPTNNINKSGTDPDLKTLVENVQGQMMQESTHSEGSVATRRENDLIAYITTPDTLELLLLRSGDVESNPGPKRNHSPRGAFSKNGDDFDDIMKKVARGVSDNADIDNLGMALGFQPTDIQRYIETNHRYQKVTCDGTLEMLRDWRKGHTQRDELPDLREALQEAGLVHLADSFLPTNKPGYPVQGRSPPIPDDLLKRVVKDIKRYYLHYLCFIQPDPLNSDILVKLGHIFTDLSLFEVEVGVKKEPPLSYSELYNVKISGLEAKRLIVVGEEGAGKTTLCAKIALDWAESRTLQQCKLVVVILLRKAKDKTVGEIVKSYLSDSNPVQARQIDEYIISNPEDVFMVLDGLDEFDGDFSGLNQFVQIILYKVFMSGTVLITTRQWKLNTIWGVSDLRKVYAFIAIEGFTKENQSKYITRFFQSDTESSERLNGFIADNDVIRENMASFPIYTAMLCVMWKEYAGESGKTMSELNTFSQLFKEMIDFLIDHYLKKKNSDETMVIETVSHHLTLIGKIAFHGLLERRLEFPEDTFQSCEESKEMGYEVGVLTRDKRARPRRDRRRNPQVEAYMVQFPHKLFQEYLSAMYLVSLHRSDPMEYDKLMADIMPEAEEFQYLLYFISAEKEKLGFDIVTGLIRNELRDDFIVDMAYESQHQSIAETVGRHLETISSELNLYEGMSAHTVSGHLFVMKHRKKVVGLSIERSCGASASRHLADFMCSSPSLRSASIGSKVPSIMAKFHDPFFSLLPDHAEHSRDGLSIERSSGVSASRHFADFMPSSRSLRSASIGSEVPSTMVKLHDCFFSVLADKAGHSRIENLSIYQTDLNEHPTASRNLARFICKMTFLKSLKYHGCEHDDFYQTVASSRLSAKVENLTVGPLDLSEHPSASRHLAHFICKMSHLKCLALSLCLLHDNFYKTAAESVGSLGKVENLGITSTDLTECPSASSHLAQFICKMSHLKSLTLRQCDELHDDFYQTVAESVGSLAKVENLEISSTDLSECPSASRHLTQLICKMSHLKSIYLGHCQLHDDFYKTAAKSVGPSAKVENLGITSTDLTECPSASSHLAQCICKMSHLKSLTLRQCELHDDFYQTVAKSVGSLTKVENLEISSTDLSRCPSASRHLTQLICKMSHLKSLYLSDCQLHNDFYKTAAKSVGLSAKIRNLIIYSSKPTGRRSSRHLAQFICKMSHLKSLALCHCGFHDDFYKTAASVESSDKVGDQCRHPLASLSELTVDEITLKRWHSLGQIFDSLKRLTVVVTDLLYYGTIQSLCGMRSLHGLQGVTELIIQGNITLLKRPDQMESFPLIEAILRVFPQLIKITFSDLNMGNANMKWILASLREAENNHLKTVRVTRCNTCEELDMFIHDLQSSFEVEVEHGLPAMSLRFRSNFMDQQNDSSDEE